MKKKIPSYTIAYLHISQINLKDCTYFVLGGFCSIIKKIYCTVCVCVCVMSICRRDMDRPQMLEVINYDETWEASKAGSNSSV